MTEDQEFEDAVAQDEEPHDAVPHDAVPPEPARAPRTLRPPSSQARRRRALLTALNVPTDGPVQLATRADGIPAPIARRRARIGVAVLCGATAAAIGLIAAAWAVRNGTLLAYGAVLLCAVLVCAPSNGERRGASARHGKGYRLLSVRTRTGIRTLDLARLMRVETRPGGIWVLDAEGVTVRVSSWYARQAVKRGVERWDVAQVEPSAAAQRVLARRNAWALILHPLRRRHERSVSLTRYP